MKSKDIKAMTKAFEKNQIQLVDFIAHGHHPKVVVIVNNKTIKYPVANSPSDVNWLRQVVRKIKRAAA